MATTWSHVETKYSMTLSFSHNYTSFNFGIERYENIYLDTNIILKMNASLHRKGGCEYKQKLSIFTCIFSLVMFELVKCL